MSLLLFSFPDFQITVLGVNLNMFQHGGWVCSPPPNWSASPASCGVSCFFPDPKKKQTDPMDFDTVSCLSSPNPRFFSATVAREAREVCIPMFLTVNVPDGFKCVEKFS